jgi:hypothetical protein
LEKTKPSKVGKIVPLLEAYFFQVVKMP